MKFMTRPIQIVRSTDFQPGTINRSIDAETMQLTQAIVDDVRANGEIAVRKYAERFGERDAGLPLWLETPELQAAAKRILATDRELLERVAGRIETFAQGATRLFTAFDDEGSGWTSRPYDRTAGASGLLRTGGAISFAFDGVDDGGYGASRWLFPHCRGDAQPI